MRRIGILAALPRELKPLVRGWKRVDAPRTVSLWTHTDPQGDQIFAACAGMGANAARRAFAAVEAPGPLDLVLSVGLAGATRAGAVVGTVSSLTEVIDAQTGERFPLTADRRKLRLATVAQTAGAVEKARLLATYGAVLVDMEASTVARLALMRGIPMMVVKAVSDLANTKLPEIDAFVDSDGQLHLPRFALHLLAHPASWGPVAALSRASSVASTSLCTALAQFLQHKDWEYTNRTGLFEKPHPETTT